MAYENMRHPFCVSQYDAGYYNVGPLSVGRYKTKTGVIGMAPFNDVEYVLNGLMKSNKFFEYVRQDDYLGVNETGWHVAIPYELL